MIRIDNYHHVGIPDDPRMALFVELTDEIPAVQEPVEFGSRAVIKDDGVFPHFQKIQRKCEFAPKSVAVGIDMRGQNDPPGGIDVALEGVELLWGNRHGKKKGVICNIDHPRCCLLVNQLMTHVSPELSSFFISPSPRFCRAVSICFVISSS